ncbi:MAG: PIN domain-containing protein [Bacillota bacterium]|jgi:predicted nucleic acid-binding protein|nr:PIN domain-containing protein [Bacillota bacterium]
MNVKVLVDTNVLVYAYDLTEPAKQEQALKVLDELATTGRGALTAQVLAEFVVAATRKIAEPLSSERVMGCVENYLRSWTVLDLTGLIVLEAVRGVREHSLSYWNAQIWATARLNQISVIFSEDFASGSVLEGVAFVNPFSTGFEISAWL